MNDAVPERSATAPASTLYRRVWRWHFFAGLLCLPFLFNPGTRRSVHAGVRYKW